jgi:hypothetical protein
MGLQPIDERRNDTRDVLATRARNNSDSLDHGECGRDATKAKSTLASVAVFQFHDF